MRMKEMERFLGQWEMDVKDFAGVLSRCPRQGSGNGGTPFGSWPRAGRPQPPPKPWNETLTPLVDELLPLVKEVPRR